MLNEYDYISGNTALVPKRKEDTREKELQKRKKKIAQVNKAKKLEARRAKDVIVVSLLMATLGAVTIGLNSHVYKMQQELTTVETAINSEKDVNEAVKVDLLQLASLNNISDAATKEMGMVYPNKQNTVNIDMSKEYFAHINDTKANDQGLIGKAMGIFN